MEVKLKKSIVDKYLETKETNILVDNIINEFLENFRASIDENLIDKYKETDSPIYFSMLELLEIDPEDNDFIHLAKSYNLKDIKELDINEYKNNPYFKNTKIANPIKFKDYILKTSFYRPYEVNLIDSINVDDKKYYKETNSLGYFIDKFPYIEIIKNDITWMSITPHEINTMKNDINKMKGNIIVQGLGLGYIAYMLSNKDDVNKISIVEKDENIIDIFNKLLFPQFKNKEKIKIIKDDAIEYINKEENLKDIDFVYCDLYHNPFDALPLYIKMKQIENKNITYLYWIEKEIVALIRRYLLSLIEEYFLGYTEKDYKKVKNNEDKIYNYFYSLIKEKVISSEDDLIKLLSDENIKNLIH